MSKTATMDDDDYDGRFYVKADPRWLSTSIL
jgi:hypothetical protein